MTDWKTVKLGDIAGNDFMDQEKLVGQDIYPHQVFPETKNHYMLYLLTLLFSNQSYLNYNLNYFLLKKIILF